MRFSLALDTHRAEASKLVKAFAGEWFSKHKWQSAGDITRREAKGFVATRKRC